ncbi:MAG: LPS export ABC transporter periplasmic protein LptC [Rhodospirillaceae bacterium]|nr:LPS export ABC transporter periplasmic protein LptC [Rhodospirillales bacterium]
MALRADSDMRPPLPKRRREHQRPIHAGRVPAHRRYSRFVGLMKVVLPSLAVVLLGLVVAWPRLTATEDRFQLSFSALSPNSVESLSMVNARYFGVNARNQPFTVTADVATEDDPNSGVIVLDQPKADFTTLKGAGIYLEARRGFYYQKQQILDLEGEVNMFHDDGYELHTEKARLDLKRSTAEGNVAVTGQGPQGRIDGQGFRILEKGAQILVTGKSSLNLKGAGSK